MLITKMVPKPVNRELVTARDSSVNKLLLFFGVFTMYLYRAINTLV